jgi:hypothetical protein
MCLGLLKAAGRESFFLRSQGNSAERAASPVDVQQCIKERGALETLYCVSSRCAFRFELPILNETIKCDFVWVLADFTHSKCSRNYILLPLLFNFTYNREDPVTLTYSSKCHWTWRCKLPVSCWHIDLILLAITKPITQFDFNW